MAANSVHHYLCRRFSFVHEYAYIVTDRDRSGFISQISDREDLIEVDVSRTIERKHVFHVQPTVLARLRAREYERAVPCTTLIKVAVRARA